MVMFSWLVKRGYKELNSNLANQSPINYDFVCVDIRSQEFGFFSGTFSNGSVVAHTAIRLKEMLKEIEYEEINTSLTYTITTTLSP